MRITLFNKDIIITKNWKKDLAIKSLYYRQEIVLVVAGFIVGFVVGVII